MLWYFRHYSVNVHVKSVPIGPMGSRWNFLCRTASTIFCRRSGCQAPNNLSLSRRLPCRSLSCFWAVAARWLASFNSVLQEQIYSDVVVISCTVHTFQFHRCSIKQQSEIHNMLYRCHKVSYHTHLSLWIWLPPVKASIKEKPRHKRQEYRVCVCVGRPSLVFKSWLLQITIIAQQNSWVFLASNYLLFMR